ncbi:hypothetical protein JW758_04030 [Candidatus Peregrinibacteria bacterium]|nr:hypothetical protein [Candidatus Peregrinibacteria bacterium]
MGSEEFTTIKAEGAEGMHGRIFGDLIVPHLPDGVEFIEPDSSEQAEGLCRLIEIKRVPLCEVLGVKELIIKNGGTIIEN